jgi:hypothetical protein
VSGSGPGKERAKVAGMAAAVVVQANHQILFKAKKNFNEEM